ncbi:MAG: hypothetical protein AB7F09_02955 [Parvibaculaceae bacterium]
MSGVVASGPAGRPLWAKLIMTVLLTVLIGPLLGTILVVLVSAVGLVPEAIMILMRDQSKVAVLFQGYTSGGVQALICGLVFALTGWICGRLPIWIPIVTALILTLLFALSLFGTSGGGLVFSGIIHIVPALTTWWLVRTYWQRSAP